MITEDMKRAAELHLCSIAGDVPDRDTAEMAVEQFLSDYFDIQELMPTLAEIREEAAKLAKAHFYSGVRDGTTF